MSEIDCKARLWYLVKNSLEDVQQTTFKKSTFLSYVSFCVKRELALTIRQEQYLFFAQFFGYGFGHVFIELTRGIYPFPAGEYAVIVG